MDSSGIGTVHSSACTDLHSLLKYVASSSGFVSQGDDEACGRHGAVEPRPGEAPSAGTRPDPGRHWQPEPQPVCRPLRPYVQLPQQERRPLVFGGDAGSRGGGSGGGGRGALLAEGDLHRSGSNPEQEVGVAAQNASAEGYGSLSVLPQGVALQSSSCSEEAQGWGRRPVAVAKVGVAGRPIGQVPTAGTGFAQSTAVGVHRNKGRRGRRRRGARGRRTAVRSREAPEECAPADEMPLGAAQ